MATLYVLHCSNGRPCRHGLDEGRWANATQVRATAEDDRLRLDEPTRCQAARCLEELEAKDDSPDWLRPAKHSFAVLKHKLRPAPCGPHRVVKYRPISESSPSRGSSSVRLVR